MGRRRYGDISVVVTYQPDSYKQMDRVDALIERMGKSCGGVYDGSDMGYEGRGHFFYFDSVRDAMTFAREARQHGWDAMVRDVSGLR